jgi:hypothetical protein
MFLGACRFYIQDRAISKARHCSEAGCNQNSAYSFKTVAEGDKLPPQTWVEFQQNT